LIGNYRTSDSLDVEKINSMTQNGPLFDHSLIFFFKIKLILTEKGKDTVRKLTRVLLNSYLVQLLETGFLHADPHPGNFLVTSEGKLCILDYGLMTTVDEDKRFALLEFVSNLLAKDYESTLDGLVILGFVPDEIVNDPAKRKIISPLLASVFEQISNGGGAFTINVGEIGKEVESLSNEYPLVIPPYFGLILRAFGALEGLGLSVDKDYSIVKECFPYLSRRLLSDDSERIRKALRTFLYGTKGRLDIDRVDELAEGYKSFAATAAAAASGKAFEELRFISSEKASSDSTLMALKIIDGQGLSPEVDPTISSATKILFSIQGTG
jgi:predicted unusual protein kinase regulating ubiquinone biosynthesis (AarF/ABC1/UbiB family)